MRYYGGKSKKGYSISNEIINVLDDTSIEIYIEPFCGALGVMKHMTKRFKNCYASDACLDLILLWNEVQQDTFKLDHQINEEEYKSLKNSGPSSLRAFAGFGLAWSGLWFNSFAPKYSTRNYQKNAIDNLNKIRNDILDITFEHKDYKTLRPKNSVIYCDPPYSSTTGSFGSSFSFDTDEFWNIVFKWSDEGNHVFISETSCPDNPRIKVIKEYTTINKTHKKTSKTFVEYLYYVMPRTIRIGTDCSGIEAPIQALLKMNVSYDHMFSSDISKDVKIAHDLNYSPKIFYNDITKRNHNELPDIDLYVCGFPCQPFSTAGNRLASQDPRGNIFFNCLEVIKAKNPKIFLLENVRGIISAEKGLYFKRIKEELAKLDQYNVTYHVFNTKDYGIPQNRNRIYMIGLLKNECTKEFEIPKKKECEPLSSYIDYTDTSTKIYPDHRIPNIDKQKGTFVDLGFVQITSPNSYEHFAPTLMAVSYMYNLKMKRLANIKELLKLQGFPIDFNLDHELLSYNKKSKLIGNSMSVNVLVEILQECFKCLKN